MMAAGKMTARLMACTASSVSGSSGGVPKMRSKIAVVSSPVPSPSSSTAGPSTEKAAYGAALARTA